MAQEIKVFDDAGYSQLSPWMIAAIAGVAVVLGGVGLYYLFLAPKAGGSSPGHGDLSVTGIGGASNTSITTTDTGTITFSVTDVTPSAEIQFGFDTSPSGVSGYAVVATATADGSGSASASYTLTPGSQDQPGDKFYALSYDTAIGTTAGYSNAVLITIVS